MICIPNKSLHLFINAKYFVIVSDEKVELYRKKLQCVVDENKSLQKQLQDAVEKLNNAHSNNQDDVSFDCDDKLKVNIVAILIFETISTKI